VLKKAGLLTVGVTAGLLAVAPIASAGEAHEKGDHDKDRESSHDKDHGKKHHSKKHHDGDQEGVGNIKCGAKGGDLDNDATGAGSLLGVGQVAGPVLSGNTGQLLSCNSFLNDNLNDLSVNILSEQAN
jgi:hypothetical protein